MKYRKKPIVIEADPWVGFEATTPSGALSIRAVEPLPDFATLALGEDQDGQKTPGALAYPDIVTYGLKAATDLRESYDEALKE